MPIHGINNKKKYEHIYKLDKSDKPNHNSTHSLSEYGITVIVCTRRSGFIDNLFENYNRQKYKTKELVIVLNDDSMNIKEWEDKAKEFENIRVFNRSESCSLGECLNYAVKKSKYPYIAKFDDDDYYTPEYLSDSMKVFKKNDKVDVIGKATFFVYFKRYKTLALKRVGKENTHGISFLTGATLIFKKKIFEKVKFADISLGEDDRFISDCIKRGIRTFSADRFNFVYIRYGGKTHHTYKIDDKDYMKGCDIIKKTDDFMSYITRKK